MFLKLLLVKNMNCIKRLIEKFKYPIRHPETGLKRQFSLKKLVNLILVRIQLKLRVSYVIGYPHFILIEPTNICNLRCPLCPTGRGEKGRSKGKMSLDKFKRIIDEIGDYLYDIELDNWGEPLLNKDIFELIRYANEKKYSPLSVVT